MRQMFSAFALSAALLTAACQNPDGSTDWGSTLLLGAGVGLAGAAVAGAFTDERDDDRRRYRNRDRRYSGHAHPGTRHGYHEDRPAYRHRY